MFSRVARIAIALILIACVWSEEIEETRVRRNIGFREEFRSPRFGIFSEPPNEPRFGFAWFETLREFYCRRFCAPSPNSNGTTAIQNLMCFIRCPDVVLSELTSTLSAGSTSTVGATTLTTTTPTTTTTVRAG